jgi:hypothetical protein
MPTFLDGQQNLGALSVPGVYIDIIPPQPTVLGSPTNFEGLVGVGSWGPLNSPAFFSTPDNCAGIFGTPMVRTRDLPSYVWAASQVGGNIGFVGVRVSDGTDTAAAVVVQTNCITLTGKYTGILGNQIKAVISTGTQAGTYKCSISFPGRSPEIFNNIGGTGATFWANLAAAINSGTAFRGPSNIVVATAGAGTTVPAGTAQKATGTITFAVQPLANATVTIGGTAITFVASGATGNQVNIGGTLAVTLTSLAAMLNASADTNIVKATYSASPTVLTVTYKLPGTAGNAFTIAASVATPSGATLAGGAAEAPITLQLAGGTDGASGVTDATLIGSDVTPRTGMYALRRTGIDAFTLCDIADQTTWAAQDSFALSESCLAVFATASGDTISGAVAARNNAGLDDFPSWLIVGDWPTFLDTQNGVSRLINPCAFALGVIGNLSPEQSPLNKQIRGISATQKSTASQAYSDAEISIAESGGVDLIVGPPTTPGGNYYTFICGRNASSNTSANGIEYSRMTFFIARSLQSKAAGSIVGRLQSIRPNDRTRADAKALADGWFASIRDPAAGSAGNGMIDDFATQCDLDNNPAYLQARGFLFLYAKVRYLNVVRYFVIKLAGGGNVDVTTQLNPPSPTQFA